MPRQDQLCFSPRRFQRRRRKFSFAPLAARKDKLSPIRRHAMQFGRIIQAEQPAFHPPARRKLRQHRGHVPPRALHSARRIQFRK